MRLDYLKETDKDIYLHLVGEFGESELSDEQWHFFFEEYFSSDIRAIYLARVFDKNMQQDVVVGTVSFLVEMKAHRQLRNCIHIEDLVIVEKFRNLGLGQQMLQLAINEAKTYTPYKIILDCAAANVGFYEKLGFKESEFQMRLNIQ